MFNGQSKKLIKLKVIFQVQSQFDFYSKAFSLISVRTDTKAISCIAWLVDLSQSDFDGGI